MSPRRQSPLTLEYILLGIISRKPIHGYNIFKELSQLDGIGMVWQLKQPQLYALLEKLEHEGLLQSTLVDDGIYPPRKEYQVTSLGRDNFELWRSSPVNHPRDLRQEFLARLFFAREAGKQITLDLLEKQELQARQWRSKVEAEKDHLGINQDYELAVNQFRIRQIDAALDWLYYCKSIMEEVK